MRLATTVKKKIIPHICQTSPRNTGTAEFAALNCSWLQSTHIQSAQQLANGSRRNQLFPMSETVSSDFLAGQLQNSRQCSLEEDR